MERNEMHRWRKWESVVNVLLIAVALLTLVRVARGLDTQDIVVEWTSEGKKLAMQRVAEWQPKEEMVQVPCGFLDDFRLVGLADQDRARWSPSYTDLYAQSPVQFARRSDQGPVLLHYDSTSPPPNLSTASSIRTACRARSPRDSGGADALLAGSWLLPSATAIP